MSLLGFLAGRRTRTFRHVPRKVLAFYYTWYGRPERHGRWVHWRDVRPADHWIGSSTHYPLKGAYDSHDPDLIAWHIDLARKSGIDGFICTWWSRGGIHDKALAKVLDIAAKKNFAATIYWETVPGQGEAKVRRAISDLLYVLKTYGDHPAFLKLDGRPVVFVYGRVMGQVELDEWPEIISRVRQEWGKDFILVADGYREGFARLFDGVHTYNICRWVRGKSPEELARLSRKAFADAVALARRHGKISCITVIPGYDDTKIRKPGLKAERQGGRTYRVLWEQAIAADPDWVLITSWNEWHEGSEIEPSWEDGDKYLRITAEFAPRFKSTPFSRASVPPPTPAVRAAHAPEIKRLLEGVEIGILPGFSGQVVFWLLDCGAKLRELAWEDVVEPGRFDPKTYPLVLYAGCESYRQSVRERGDVDRALLGYLRRGGFLIVLPSGPFPFYYNEKQEAVVTAPRLGLPIGCLDARGKRPAGADPRVRNWEDPPEGAKLSFRLDTALLPGLPATVAFPQLGDLRWRPVCASALAKGDVYIPLAKLTDERGNHYGDAIAYIEHRASEPRGARLIYAWMRMADILDADTLFFDLFGLAARKLREGGAPGHESGKEKK